MAPPEKVKSTPPDTLPSDFFEKQSGGVPETLPGDFNFEGADKAGYPHYQGAPHIPTMRENFQEGFDKATTAEPYSMDAGVLGNAGRAFRNLGGGFLSLATPVVHPQKTVEGIAKMAGDEMFPQTSGNLLEPVMKHEGETTGQYAGRLGGEATQAVGALVGGEGLSEIPGAIATFPTKARAGALLNEVSTAAKGMPVQMSRTLPEIENAQRLSMWGHGTITPIDSLYQRMQTINPIDFEEARGRYQPLTRLTANDKMSATKPLQAAAKRTAHAMRDDIGDTAEQVGMRDQYERGMNMYHNASRIDEAVKAMKKWAIPTAAGALGLEGIHRMARSIK